ncbi:MAG: hypothetical protein ACREEM_48555 [Blastocatellia bacterium]
MTEDITKDLTDSEKLNLILARLGALEAITDERSRDTRPLLDSLHEHVDRLGADLQEIKAIVKRLDSGFTQLSRELIDIKARQNEIEAVTYASRNP